MLHSIVVEHIGFVAVMAAELLHRTFFLLVVVTAIIQLSLDFGFGCVGG